MSDETNDLIWAARRAVCPGCAMGGCDGGARCQTPNEVLALIERLRQARDIEAAARAYVEAYQAYDRHFRLPPAQRETAALGFAAKDAYAVLVKAMEGGDS